MEGVGTEVSLKIRSAIKAKLVELGTYVDEELPDYIMVLVANKKTKDQMDDDLSLFLGHNTERFTSWLHHVLQKLNAAALLQVTTPQPQLQPPSQPQEEPKKKEPVEEKKREKDEKREKFEKKREIPMPVEEVRKVPLLVRKEEIKKVREEEKQIIIKEKEVVPRKRKNTEKKKDKKEKKLKRIVSPSLDNEVKEKRTPVETVKPGSKPRDLTRKSVEKEQQEAKERKCKEIKEKESKEDVEKDVKENKEKESKGEKEREVKESTKKKLKPFTTGNKVSSADIFRAEAGGGDGEEEEEEDMLVLRAEDELGLDLEEEPTPRKGRGESREKGQQRGAETRPVVREVPRTENEAREKKLRVSVKDRLGAPVTSRTPLHRDKVSVVSRVSIAPGGRRVVNLHEGTGGSGSRREETASGSAGLARVVSSAITSACRSVCVLPSHTASGKKLEARVRPLMSQEVVSSGSGAATGRISSRESSRSETAREGSRSEVVGKESSRGEAATRESSRSDTPVRAGSSRVVSAVGAVLKRSYNQVDSEEEEYDPKKPQLGGMASKVEVAPRPRRMGAIQANTALILRAVADAHKSVTRPQAHQPKSHKSNTKLKSELFTRSYREREEARQSEKRVQEEGPEVRMRGEGEEVRIRKIAITVPNAARKESERQLKEEEMKEEEEQRPHVPEAAPEKKDEQQQPEQPEQPELSTSPLIETVFNVEEMEEEVEEEEEEVVLEMSPPRITPELAPVNETTKFIVTLEGVEEGVDLRERLGNRQPPTQIEEYIEEVEEWEEEEEETCDPGSIQPTPLLTAAKATSPTLSLTHPNGSKERCKYWPVCKSGDGCAYHHPTVSCKSFPACKYGDKCLFIHPNCLYDAACTRLGCPYTHASARNFALASAAASQKHKVMAPRTGASKMKCKFFPKCTNMSCPFLHPKACYYGTSCTQDSCPFTHPAIPTGAKLKWVATKTASAPPLTTNKEGEK